MYQGQTGIEFGEVGCRRNRLITSINDLDQIREELKINYGDRIVFINFKLLNAHQ
jgi:hypothetical protein